MSAALRRMPWQDQSVPAVPRVQVPWDRPRTKELGSEPTGGRSGEAKPEPATPAQVVPSCPSLWCPAQAAALPAQPTSPRSLGVAIGSRELPLRVSRMDAGMRCRPLGGYKDGPANMCKPGRLKLDGLPRVGFRDGAAGLAGNILEGHDLSYE